MRPIGAERILERLPSSRELAMTFAGVDPLHEPVPVRPGAHYHMGGVDTDNDGLTELTGLYAAGEAACVSVHGAKRLGGNSLMETLTFGRRSGRGAAERAVGRDHVGPPLRACRGRVGALAHDGGGAGVPGARRRARHPGAPRPRR